MIRNLGLEHADEIGAAGFVASSFWIHKSKKRHNYVYSKVTGYESRAEAVQQDSIEESRGQFLESYRSVRGLFPYRLIFNVDQSGFKYEISNLRTISRKGERDTIIKVDNKNKNTHSYTLQPMIARDGTLAGKLLLCL